MWVDRVRGQEKGEMSRVDRVRGRGDRVRNDRVIGDKL